MTKPQVAHETITTSRPLKASPEQVFQAWADPAARTMWGPSSKDDALEFVEVDFRVGGKDIHICGPKGDLRFRVETSYHEIHEPTRLLFTEHVSAGGTTLCASLVTVDLAEAGAGTKLDVTIQVASLVGEPMLEGNRSGWQAALENLRRHLEESV